MLDELKAEIYSLDLFETYNIITIANKHSNYVYTERTFRLWTQLYYTRQYVHIDSRNRRPRRRERKQRKLGEKVSAYRAIFYMNE